MRLFPAVLTVVFCALSWADFSYEQTSKITGGAMMSMMRVAGAFSKQAREPIKTTIVVKGNRMATLHQDTATVTDLDKETITQINFKEKTYSVMTFAEMKEALTKSAQRMGQKDENVDMKWKLDVKDTGQSKAIQGQNCSQHIVTITTEVKDQKSGQTGEMKMVSDMWLAPDVAGYEEIRKFHERMAAKLDWSSGQNFGAMMGGRAEFSQGMKEMQKQAAKLQGIPVLQITTMGGEGAGAPPAAAGAERPQAREQEQPAGPTSGEVAESAAGSAAGSQLGRVGLGGLGGFGRRRKTEKPAEPPAAPPQQQSQQQPAPAQPASAGSLMEITSELGNFSSGSVDASKLEVPDRFKQVDSEMKKLLNKK